MRQPTRSRKRGGRRRVRERTTTKPWRGTAFGCLLTFLLLYLSFPDPHLDFLVWVSFVPAFLALRGIGVVRGFVFLGLAGVIGEGFGFFWAFQSFVEFTGWSGWLTPLAGVAFVVWLLYDSVLWGVLGGLVGWSTRTKQLHVAVLAWVGIEALFPRLFPWHLGDALYDREWLRQAADLFGASGLSYLILFVNVVACDVVQRSWRGEPSPRFAAATAMLLLVVANLYGIVRLDLLRGALELAPSARVGLVQPVVPTAVKHDRGEQGQRFARALLRQTFELGACQPLDLVVWPEGVDFLPFNPREGEDPLSFHRDKETGRLVFDGLGVPLLSAGASLDGKQIRNSAAYILPEGETFDDGSRARLYHKNHLLLFGETTPFWNYLPDTLRRALDKSNIVAGHETPIFLLKSRACSEDERVGRPFGFRVLICYEAILPDYVRRVSEGVDLLINQTEDIWFGRTPHASQHLSVIRMRVVENRVPLVRCTNCGPSGLIDVTGELTDSTVAFVPQEKVLTVRTGAFFSLYRFGGHCLPFVCLGLAGVLSLVKPLAGALRSKTGTCRRRPQTSALL